MSVCNFRFLEFPPFLGIIEFYRRLHRRDARAIIFPLETVVINVSKDVLEQLGSIETVLMSIRTDRAENNLPDQRHVAVGEN